MPSFVLPDGAATEVKRVFLYREGFVFQPVDIVLREQPTHDGDTVALLEGGTHNIEKMKTVDDGWIRVRVRNHEKQELLTGYVEASELMVIN